MRASLVILQAIMRGAARLFFDCGQDARRGPGKNPDVSAIGGRKIVHAECVREFRNPIGAIDRRMDHERRDADPVRASADRSRNDERVVLKQNLHCLTAN